MRRHRVKAGVKMFEAEEIRAMIDGKNMRGEAEGEPKSVIVKADLVLRAMILLGVNAGFGNGDVAALPLGVVNLETSWLTFPRPKTGVERKC
jgi:hypothetical protein